MKIFTWNVHGGYLYYLSQGNYTIYIPVSATRSEEGYQGRGAAFPYGANVIEVPAEEVPLLDFDCVLYQTNKNYLVDQYRTLSEKQRSFPRVYLEHDPPKRHPTDTVHIMQDPDVSFVHVNHFNRLMWDNGNIDTTVIDHGVTRTSVKWTGELEKGIVVLNNLPSKGRLLGFDLLLEARKHVAIDLVGKGTGEHGLGEIHHSQLPQLLSRYRFFYHPVRWASPGLAVCEALMAGIPLVTPASTELSGVICNGIDGVMHTDTDYLIRQMKRLVDDHGLASRIGEQGRELAMHRFCITRFAHEWEQVFRRAVSRTNAARMPSGLRKEITF